MSSFTDTVRDYLGSVFGKGPTPISVAEPLSVQLP